MTNRDIEALRGAVVRGEVTFCGAADRDLGLGADGSLVSPAFSLAMKREGKTLGQVLEVSRGAVSHAERDLAEALGYASVLDLFEAARFQPGKLDRRLRAIVGLTP